MSYPQLVNLFEEIFVFQVYKFSYGKSNPFIIDCGSNIGLAVLYFKKLYPQSKILAFEPDQEAFETLLYNIQSNNLFDVLAYNYALSDREAETLLYKHTVTGSLNMSLIQSSNAQAQQCIQTKKLSDYIDTDVDLLKIDVEGSEIEIINDLMVNKKLQRVKNMIIEYHPHLTKVPMEEFMDSIQDSGFTCNSIKDNLHAGAFEVLIHGKNNS